MDPPERQEEGRDMSMEEVEGEGEEDSSLLEPGPEGEEEGEVDVEEEERLLKEGEVNQENQDEMSGEDFLRNFMGHDYKDPTKNERNNLSDLNINSAKDFTSDDENFETKLETQANANDSECCEISQENNYNSTKHAHDSTLNYQDESEHLLSSTTTALNDGEVVLVDKGDEEEEGGDDKVEYVKEVKGGEERQEGSTREERSSAVCVGHPVATTDIRCKEVKSRHTVNPIL
jgi:hypothetical protein